MDCFSGLGLRLLLTVKENVNASAHQDILDNPMLPTLWEQFWEFHLLFHHNCSPVHEERSSKIWLDEFGVQDAVLKDLVG